jgi:glycosyltransferase involved in cell wall biosynthesis
MKTFGIYLCYPPKVDLRSEGLGRYLAEFLKEARHHQEVRFVIACPSWMRKSLGDLFESAQISTDTFEIIGPKDFPVLLHLYDLYQAYRSRSRKPRLQWFFDWLRRFRESFTNRFVRTLATSRNPILVLLLLVVGVPFAVLGYLAGVAARLAGNLKALIAGNSLVRQARTGLFKLTAPLTTPRPQDDFLTRRLYRFMEESEADLICSEINRRPHISAWYSPTAFWPHFNNIVAPRLTCVPDVVLAEFPVGFSFVDDDRFLEIFRLVEKTIKGGDRFVTYSQNTKYRTLTERYRVAPEATSVIPHGAHRLDSLIRVSGFDNATEATDAFCRTLFGTALGKAIGTVNTDRFDSGEVRFVFYASQFRPNKNVLTLLRAFDHLLKRRFAGQKLVLTGNPRVMPEIAKFIRERNLQNDVLCLHGLSDQQLAACYRLADLAVNPSFSEGGCPFTLTEALSVGTPVVMARIAVTEEVVTDPALKEVMLFDPYDWRDMAQRIEWALNNRDFLLRLQLTLYEILSKRSWRDVVDEHILLLDQISTARDSPTGTAGGGVLNVNSRIKIRNLNH